MEHREFSFNVRIPWPAAQAGDTRLTRFLPTPGNVIFTLLIIGLLLWASSAGALPLRLFGPDALSTNTIAYQGRLADAGGAPLTGTYSIIFRLYNAITGGAPLWEEQWTGQSGVEVSDGLFNVMLGSLTSIPQAVVTGNNTLWLGITVGTDNEMTPRVQLGSVPFAVQALTVPAGSVTTAKIADQAVTQAKLGPDVNLVPPDGSITTAKLADGAVTTAKLASDIVIPFVPRVLKFVNKQNDLVFASDPNGTPRVVETISFVLPQPPNGYRWDLAWHFNQRFGAMYQQSVGTSFLLDGTPIKDSTGAPFMENSSLYVQFSPMDNMIFGGTVYQNNVTSGEHVLTWQAAAYGEPSNEFLIRQRWLVLTAILVPQSF